MSETIASISPAGLPVARPAPGSTAADQPDVPEISFRELWADKKSGFGFADLLDIVNPLQHLPVIGALYRGVTGDGIGLGARLVGGALYGGPLGMLGSVMMAAADQAVGGEPGARAIAFVREMFDDKPDAATVQVAAVSPAAGPADNTDNAEDGAPAAPTAPAAPAAPAAMARGAAPAPADVSAPTVASAPASVSVSAPVPAVAAMPLREFPAHPRPKPVSRGLAAPLRPGLGALRHEAAPGPAPFSPAPSSSAPGPGARTTGDAESRRIIASVQAAQRAQAGLLLASLAAGAPAPPTSGAAGASLDAAGADAVGGHSFLPPGGASPAWVERAMEEALAKYQKSRMLRRPPPGVPGQAPLTPQ